MTKQARKLLKKLKEAQQLEDLAFGIDFDGLEAVTLCMDNEDVKTVDISEHSGALQTTLDYLDGQGYIEMGDSGCGQVLHAGWHRGQILFSKFLQFLIKSVVVPIVVSFLTALITVLVKSHL